MRFYAFDLLYDRGKSLLRLPLIRRRELLKNTVTALSDPVLPSETFDTAPPELAGAKPRFSLFSLNSSRLTRSAVRRYISPSEKKVV